MSNKVFWGMLIIVVVGFGIISTASKKSDTTLSKGAIKTIEGVKEYDKKEKYHIQANVDYPETPSVGGNHNPVWVGCDQKVYSAPVQEEMATHALEHGAVWLTYRPGLAKDQVDKLAKKVKKIGATFLSPYPDLPAPIMLSSWGTQLSVQSADDQRIEQFMTKYSKGPKAPEPAATCAAPQGSGM